MELSNGYRDNWAGYRGRERSAVLGKLFGCEETEGAPRWLQFHQVFGGEGQFIHCCHCSQDSFGSDGQVVECMESGRGVGVDDNRTIYGHGE
jgi:hypothetical protein